MKCDKIKKQVNMFTKNVLLYIIPCSGVIYIWEFAVMKNILDKSLTS